MKWTEYVRDNAWTWAGAVYLLLTLTGATLFYASIVTALTVVLHYLFSAKGDDNE